MAGASTAATPSATRPARRPTPVTSLAVAAATAVPKVESSHVPTLMGDVGLATRSMLMKRRGWPRSATRRAPLTPTAVDDASRQRRARRWSPVSRPPAANRAEPPATPPVKK